MNNIMLRFKQRLLDAIPNDDEEFTYLISQGLQLQLFTEDNMASQFGVSLSTIRRWELGQTFPHAAMRTPIIKWIHDLIPLKDPS